jgi:hypothetical protein
MNAAIHGMGKDQKEPGFGCFSFLFSSYFINLSTYLFIYFGGLVWTGIKLQEVMEEMNGLRKMEAVR